MHDINISQLDKLIEQQQDPKVNGILNEIINNPLSFNKIGEILGSNNFKTKYFGLTIIENVIKKQLSSLTAQQKASMLQELLMIATIAPFSNYIEGSDMKNLVFKKSASLMGMLMGRDLSQETLVQVQQLIQRFAANNVNNNNNNSATSGGTISILQIFQSLASEVRKIKEDRQFLFNYTQSSIQPLIKEIFQMIFIESVKVIKESNDTIVNYKTLQIEALNTLKAIVELVDIELLLNQEALQLIFLKSQESYFRGACVLVFIEYISAFIQHQNKVTVQQFQDYSVKFIPYFFGELMRTSLSQQILTATRKDIKKHYSSQSKLYSNFCVLLSLLLKNFIEILYAREGFQESDRFTSIMLSILELESGFILDYHLEKCKFLKQSKNIQIVQTNQPRYLEFYKGVYHLLKRQNRLIFDDSEQDPPINGILCNLEDKSLSDWIKYSETLEEIIIQYSGLYGELVNSIFVEKFKYLLYNTRVQKQSSDEIGCKIQSIFWIFGVSMGGYQVEPGQQQQFFTQLISVEVNDYLKESIFLGVLFILRFSPKLLRVANAQFIHNIIQIVITQFLMSGKTCLVEMSVETLSILLDKPHISKASPDRLDSVLMNQAERKDLFSERVRLKIFECVGSYLGNRASQPGELQQYLQVILEQYLKQLQSQDLLKSTGIKAYGKQTNYILSALIHLEKGLNSNNGCLVQFLIPILDQTYKWTCVKLQPEQEYLPVQLSFKKKILEIYEDFVLHYSSDQIQNLLNQMNSFLSIMTMDELITSSAYSDQVLPKIITFLSYFLNSVYSVLQQNEFINQILDRFLPMAFQLVMQQQLVGKGSKLYQDLVELINVLVLHCPQFMVVNDRLVNYLMLTNNCLKNQSPLIHSVAIQSLINYFSNVTSTILTLATLKPIFISEITIITEFSCVLQLLSNPIYQNSFDIKTNMDDDSIVYSTSTNLSRETVNSVKGNLPYYATD
ncbi:hypothetical protein DLAC_01624 [Tieghemostelium lacteum]|uniref:Uncharacterized protein n=1 Tax=Tieghemostelium lacteum TaxID=361077 RepID=A0A152A5W3_TIELA|nr:hypothetical protein DLAC_01624 [Tieghemostelium lacteum]|eukprot:KYR01624.1 hypothetical protein DLAC_01624 [Tieghemostelium lacteum]